MDLHGLRLLCCVGGRFVRRSNADLGFEKDVSTCTQTSAAARSGAPHVCHRLADVSVYTSPAIQHTPPSVGPLLLLWYVSSCLY